MKPTAKLRFVQRSVHMGVNGGGKDVYQIVRILQQWWETVPMGTVNLGWTGDIPLGEVKGEWRDVPLEADV
jgi:hypothetical protein